MNMSLTKKRKVAVAKVDKNKFNLSTTKSNFIEDAFLGK